MPISKELIEVSKLPWFPNVMKELGYESMRHGHWINHFDDLYPEDSSVECSVCHEYEGIMANDNYCPNCGAKMDEEEEDRHDVR